LHAGSTAGNDAGNEGVFGRVQGLGAMMRDIVPPVLVLVLVLAWVAHVSASQDASIDRAHAVLKSR
jgi:fumarate reductase subunit D